MFEKFKIYEHIQNNISIMKLLQRTNDYRKNNINFWNKLMNITIEMNLLQTNLIEIIFKIRKNKLRKKCKINWIVRCLRIMF